MNRKTFYKQSLLISGGIMLGKDLLAKSNGPVFGHNGMRYEMDLKWGTLDSSKYPVNDCHEMVQDKAGRILLLTNETKNNILIYNTAGKLLDAWGHAFPGAHGLTLHNENGTDFLYITDTVKHQVYKSTMEGKILLTIDYPSDSGVYTKKEEFVPTETAIGTNGDIYIADGYGAQYILHYDASGKLKHFFGGKGEGVESFSNAHGICFDTRLKDPRLLITDRTRNCFKYFTLEGKYIDMIKLPGACVCRPVIQGKNLYAAVLRSPDMSATGSGFVTILDEKNKVVSNIGGTAPVYIDDELQAMSQGEKIFVHPHDVCVDRDENIYVAQWSSGKVYPYKFKRVG